MCQKHEPSAVERTGKGFEPRAMELARQKTWHAVETIASRIRPGMREEEGQALANAVIQELGAEKRWHRSWVRFGVNTLKPYGVPSEPGVVLGDDDIFFVDIGPVWNGHEGDAGRTYVTGHDDDMRRCAEDGRAIHALVKRRWETEGATGSALYEYAGACARERGWELNLFEANGHRLSDFPHALYFKGGISDVDFRPTPGLWVLEIQIRHPKRPFGSFHEDLLV